MKKIIAVIALATSMSVAYANEPVALTDSQMDNVSAGGFAFATGVANALGALTSGTYTTTSTTVQVLAIYPVQGGQITYDIAQSSSHSEAGAQ